MNRKLALEVLKIAGYHGDRKTFCRVYVEHRISRKAADKAWLNGIALKSAGMKCGCPSCKGAAA